MRIWDVDPRHLCRQHLLGEHRELHAIWTVLQKEGAGYRRHPETLRWEGKLAALALRHDALVAEMQRRGYRHASPLDPELATGCSVQEVYVDTPDRQLDILTAKPCPCLLPLPATEPGSGEAGFRANPS